MPNKINWKEIPGLVGEVLEELVSLPTDVAKNVFNSLKENKSKAAELASSAVRERHNIIAGLSPNVNIERDRPTVERPGAPTADAVTPTFAGLSPDEEIEGVASPGSPIGNTTFAGSAETAALEKTVGAQGTSSSDQRDAWIENKTAKKDDKIVGLFGSLNEDELFRIPEDELSKMVESVTGKKPSGIFDIRDNALTLLDEAKKLQTSRSR